MRVIVLSGILLVACGGRRDAREAPAPTATPHVTAMTGDDDRCDPAVPKICMGEDVVECGADGRLGRRLRACHKGCSEGRCEQTCEDDNTKLIYLVSTDNDFLSFDPRKLPGDPFHLIGKLKCRGGGSPFSMSVDRNGTAWVLYGDGELFKVNINDAKCEPTAFGVGATGALTFGMGFSTDQAGGDSEKLYVANNELANNDLWSIDTAHHLQVHRSGPLTATTDQNPELTGTSEGKLFGFYPSFTEPSFVQEINRGNGAPIGRKWPLGNQSLGSIEAYAFAQWGGVFYIFATVADPDTFEQSSTVRTVDRATGKYRTIMAHARYRISGAGVSTCAPERDASNQPMNPPGP